MKFLKEFFTNPKQTGAVSPSSDKLAELITNSANLKSKTLVVELGSGNGVFTKKIYKKIKSNTKCFVLEINSCFVKETLKNCPPATVYHDSAENIEKYILKHNMKNCDCIISGLPWAAFDKNLQNKLLNSIYNSLEHGGVFLTFAYIQGLLLPSGKNFNRLLKSKFKSVKKTKTIWSNLPPAFIYICKK